MGHLHLSVVKNRHLADLLLHVHPVDLGILLLDLSHEPAVDLLHDLVDSGKKPRKQVDGPFLQSLRHDGMVGIGAGSGGDVPCLLPAKMIIVQKDAHQLRHRHRGMGIVELECHLLRKTMDIVMLSHIFLHGLLNGSGDEEILLL